jgi:aspartokinase/homoserine dehydrogenase 1
MKILKFGGSTLDSPEHIHHVLKTIEKSYNEYGSIAVVISALKGMTDLLIEMSRRAEKHLLDYKDLFQVFSDRHLDLVHSLFSTREKPVREEAALLLDELKDTLHGVYLVKELTPKTLDFILSFGERLAAMIVTRALAQRGMDVEYLDTRLVVVTDENFGAARVHYEQTVTNILEYMSTHPQIQVITGFIASTVRRETTSLGRGGSDYTATLFASALNAEEVEIWTNVDGVMTADPQKVPQAISIDLMSYEEAMEMTHFGARIIYPSALQPVAAKKIPIRIRNTFNPAFPGTLISDRSKSSYPVTGISSIDHIALLRIQGSGMIGVAGISNRLFNALARHDISVILISQGSSEHSICIAVHPDSAEAAREAIEREFGLEIQAGQTDPVIVEYDLSIVAVVGENMQKTTGIAGRLFQALGKNGINVVAIAQGSSELNISVVVNKSDESKSLNAVHEAFFLSHTKTLHLFVAGTGLIGGTLLKQIRNHSRQLAEKAALNIRLIGVGNIDGMLLSEKGIDYNKWRESLDASQSGMNLDRFLQSMIAMNLPNTVFVDATGSDEPVRHYEAILNASISIVTPNKIANSGPYERYKILKDAASKHGVKFLYETNVGAGLPVISTLNDLLSSGDQIRKIEAILSGTVSYIFNTFRQGLAFSAVVREAQRKGLSEPDPRDDLNGRDVARKLLILARECGYPLEPSDIELENILPENCRSARTVEEFFMQLEKVDGEFENLRREAEEEGRVLRYVATLQDGAARIALRSVGPEHPFWTLSGSDNMIVFTTERYQERPLVVQGPGAGAEVTAAGVFADIIRIAHYLS